MSRAVASAPSRRGHPKHGARAAWALLLVAALFAFPFISPVVSANPYLLVFLYYIFFWVTQATSWNIFSGYAGYLNFGQNAFYGAGVYTTVLMESHLDAPLFWDLAVGAAVAASIGLISGLLVFRLRVIQGEIFALFTLALGLGLGLTANNVKAIDGGAGAVLGDVSYPSWLGPMNQMLYLVSLCLAIVAVTVAYRIQHSRMGYGLAAIRDDEFVGESLGVPAFRYKLTAFTLGAALAGASGALDALLIAFIFPAAAFGPEVAMFVIVMSFVGGRRVWLGPLLGAVLVFTLSDRLSSFGLAELNQIIVGGLLILIVIGLKEGIVAQLFRRAKVSSAAAALGVVVMIALGWGPQFITVMLVGILAELAVLLVPEDWYQRLARRSKVIETAQSDDPQSAPPPAAPESLRDGVL